MTSETDAELIAASLWNGQRFAVLFERHHDRIWRYLGRRAGAAAADDLAAETFTRAFASRVDYDHAQADAAPWLYGIATNLLRERARKRHRRDRAYLRAVHAQPESDAPDRSSDADARLDAEALVPALRAALARLRPEDRDALLLLALTELSYEGIASATGVPVGTVRSRLHRARRHMRAALGDDPDSISDLQRQLACPRST